MASAIEKSSEKQPLMGVDAEIAWETKKWSNYSDSKVSQIPTFDQLRKTGPHYSRNLSVFAFVHVFAPLIREQIVNCENAGFAMFLQVFLVTPLIPG